MISCSGMQEALAIVCLRKMPNVVEVDHLEECIAAEGKEGRSNLNYVTNPMNIYFGILIILQKVLTKNSQILCGASPTTLQI